MVLSLEKCTQKREGISATAASKRKGMNEGKIN
jgi:hypothetical protein